MIASEDAFNTGASATNFLGEYRLELTYVAFYENIIGSSVPIFIPLVLLLPLFMESNTGSNAKFEKTRSI